MQDEKLLIMDPSDRKFISQNLRVILDNLMEPITSKALSLLLFIRPFLMAQDY